MGKKLDSWKEGAGCLAVVVVVLAIVAAVVAYFGFLIYAIFFQNIASRVLSITGLASFATAWFLVKLFPKLEKNSFFVNLFAGVILICFVLAFLIGFLGGGGSGDGAVHFSPSVVQ